MATDPANSPTHAQRQFFTACLAVVLVTRMKRRRKSRSEMTGRTIAIGWKKFSDRSR